MKNLRFSIRFAFTFAFLLSCCFAAQVRGSIVVGPSRVFVSGVGSDVNPCSRTAPCRTFQQAHDVVAAAGEVVVLDAAGYGQVTISKSVSIIGDGVYAGVTVPAGDGITINSGTAIVALRNLTINGLGTGTNGVNVTSVGDLHVEGCVISGFTGFGILVSLAADGSRIFIKDTITRNNNTYGVFIKTSTGTVRASIDNCRSERNGLRGFVAANNSRVTINRSVASGNDGNGFHAFSDVSGATAELSCEECVSSNNSFGFAVDAPSGAATIRVSHSTATNNTFTGFAQFSGVFESLGNNLVRGNPSGDTLGTITGIALQ